jgi:hypothetical protein
VEEIKARREGTIEVVEALGELDMSALSHRSIWHSACRRNPRAS